MQVWLNFLLMVTLAAMVGVSISLNYNAIEQARIQRYLDENPQINKTVAEALLHKDLIEGMDGSQLKVIWGKPSAIQTVTLTNEDGSVEKEFWAYPDVMIMFENGAVQEWVSVRSKYDTGEDVARRFAYVMTTPLEDRMANIIRKGQITLGMTPEQVEASWGEPKDVIPVYNENTGEFTVWVFERGAFGHTTVTFQEGEVLSWADFKDNEDTGYSSTGNTSSE